MPPNSMWTLAEWVTHVPHAAAIFESHQLDYCCDGKRLLQDACAEKGLEMATVVSELQSIEADSSNPARDTTDYGRLPLSELCDHIEFTHHVYLRSQLPRLEQWLTKVLTAHGPQHPELEDVAKVFRALTAELVPHMLKEEHVLFPAIRRLATAESHGQFPFGSVQNPIRMMEHEHDIAGRCLHELRRLTHDYAPPEDACATWRQLLQGLQELEQDLHLHIHKENNILFPAAARLEATHENG